MSFSFSFLGELLWGLYYALPIILITAVLNKGKTLRKSIIKGAIIGILGWFFFYIYNYIECSLSPDFYNWGLFVIFLIFIFLPLILISSMIGLVTSYFGRKHIEKRKKRIWSVESKIRND
jgi:hypothetical protein